MTIVKGPFGAGDTTLVHPLLPDDLAEVAFERLIEEVDWRTMVHRGGAVPRRVAVQGSTVPLHSIPDHIPMGAHHSEAHTDNPINEAPFAFPIYRHPADSPPDLHQKRFTETVDRIRKIVEGLEDVGHELNHVLIQHYRSGSDFISEHSDKTLDVVKGTKIVNVSLGAERVMTLRLKKDRNAEEPALPPGAKPPPRPTQRISLPHNSVFVMGLDTNKKFLHGIHHDNRPSHTKTEEETSCNGARISLTFRCIGTYLVPTENGHFIYGQGATAKALEGAKLVPPPPNTLSTPAPVGGEEGPTAGLDPEASQETVQKEVEEVIRAFGEENFSNGFDWDKWYGKGFDVIHFV
ncbi:hypothetical protein FA15DRAFT_668031 [Coprinopsis marcescibilis]|uniref:Fe2OG dioxygenase domain-containing protein n=1 Tax=Coprinopsis marcescibilis TaxID=230819 RepID=A0A5C3KZK7_COPMA|nr:hypothetical protein FA15DRAFT_668031 [Coprinopsis marcescibilis]